LPFQSSCVKPETLQMLHRTNIDRSMPVHATSPSKVSTSFQRWNQPHYRTSCYVIPLFPLPATVPSCAHLMQLLRRVSNASQHDKSLSIFIEGLTVISDFLSELLAYDYITWRSGKSRSQSLSLSLSSSPPSLSLSTFLPRAPSLARPITNADLNTFPPNRRKS